MSGLLIVVGLMMLILGLFQKISLYRKQYHNSLSEKTAGNRIYRGYKKSRKFKSVKSNLTDIACDESSNVEEKLFSSLSQKNSTANLYHDNNKSTTNIDKPGEEKINEINEKINAGFKNILKQSSRRLNISKLPEKYREVIVLNRKKKNIDEIARELDLGVRETRLILKFHREKVGTNGKK